MARLADNPSHGVAPARLLGSAKARGERIGAMTPYTDRDLDAMMSDIESDLVERKESLRGDAPKKIRQAVCAFANDLPDHRRPGIVFVGVDDDGRPVGADITDRLLLQLGDIKTDGNIVPPPTMAVRRLRVSDREVAVVAVHPSDTPPVRYRGQIWIRVGPRRAIASVQDERILNEKRRHRDPHFDARPIRNSDISDLSLAHFQHEYLPGALSPQALAANDRTLEERLAAAKMIVSVADPTPTVAGIVVLGNRPPDHLPGAYVQFLRISGTDLAGDVLDAERCEGPLTNMLRRLEDKLVGHNRTSVDIKSARLEIRRSTHSIAALRELVHNAVMHRAYEGTNAPVRVVWFDDRVEITSPGTPFGDVTPENFGQPGVVDYRNPTIAEAMRALRLVQRYGVGIPLARKELGKNDQEEPEFHVSSTPLRCVVHARRGA